MDKTRAREPSRPGTRAAAPSPDVAATRKPLFARAVGSFVPRITRKAMEKYGFSTAALLTDWASIVGPELAGYTAPERLKWPRQVEAYGEVEAGSEGRPGATLVLRVDGARALDVQYRSRQIVERINAYFGYRAVAEIRLIQAPVTQAAPLPRAVVRPPAPAHPLPEVAGIGNDRLKAALTRLQASLEAEAQVRSRQAG